MFFSFRFFSLFPPPSWGLLNGLLAGFPSFLPFPFCAGVEDAYKWRHVSSIFCHSLPSLLSRCASSSPPPSLATNGEMNFGFSFFSFLFFFFFFFSSSYSLSRVTIVGNCLSFLVFFGVVWFSRGWQVGRNPYA